MIGRGAEERWGCKGYVGVQMIAGGSDDRWGYR